MIDTRELADPEFFARLESVELRARSVVEGFLHGLHRSPYIGFSVEFASHHEYVQGDDPRHINWKLFARQHRLYVKEFDGDTNLNLYILLDVSSSMGCANLGRSADTVPQKQTDAGRAIHQAAELCRKRGLVVVISDCFDEVPRIMDGLDHLQFLRHEVVLFHVL